MKKDMLVTIRSNRYGLDIELDSEADFRELLTVLTEKFRDSARFFKDASMALSFSGRELDRIQEEQILNVIHSYTQIEILCIIERNDRNEPMYKSVVEYALSDIRRREGEFYRGTLGRRQVLETESSIVILGDVEPEACVTATLESTGTGMPSWPPSPCSPSGCASEISRRKDISSARRA